MSSKHDGSQNNLARILSFSLTCTIDSPVLNFTWKANVICDVWNSHTDLFTVDGGKTHVQSDGKLTQARADEEVIRHASQTMIFPAH